MMDIQTFLDHIRDLTDLELAVLLSLIAQQNCLITTDDELIDYLSSELALISSEIFKLPYAVVSQEDYVSVEKFGEAILDQNLHGDFGANDFPPDDVQQPHSGLSNIKIRAASVAPSRNSQANNLDSRAVANIVIAKNFNLAPRDVQIAALELSTRRRIYSRTTVHQVPKTFLFLPIISTDSRHIVLNEHLNDRISISHHHDSADGFANLEELDPDLQTGSVQDAGLDGNKNSVHSRSHSRSRSRSSASSAASSSASVSRTALRQQPVTTPHISSNVIDQLRHLGHAATVAPDVRRYMQDIVVFLRMARGVDGGVTPFATTQFVNLAKYLAPLHGIDFVTPSLVALAARKVYAHRVVIAHSSERERSTQWGSDRELVEEGLEGLTAEAVIDDVLTSVPCLI